ncbi:hypothetical protein Q75_08865 [Bacillus coahuilensis p1.1.43]|uniref:Sigma-X negative effector n=1 Tax=Bacillus coahuilensis p1.1.43 TaxID=1150625 RepID=A0A147K814_9BACI|nr:hypothetical protein [Bacillus coahuilensis]KUP06240.1 hypothetical protein Q75_08865 [Bacillus coahuilensis p1.1.43]
MKETNEEKQLTKLLKQMPDIEDRRSKEDIYRKIMTKEATTYYRYNWSRPIIGIISLFLLTIVTYNLLAANDSEVEYSQEDTVESKQFTESSERSLPLVDESEKLNKDASAENSILLEEESSKDGEKAYDIANLMDFIQLGTLTENGDVIPITVPIMREETTSINAMVEAAKQSNLLLNDNQLTVLPLTGEFSEIDETTLLYTMGEDENWNVGTAGESAFIRLLEQTFEQSEYREIRVENHDGTTPEFSHTGHLPSILMKDQRLAYYSYPISDKFYLIPSFQSFDTIDQAFQSMKEKQNDLMLPTIPSTFEFTLNSNGETLTITSQESFSIASLEVSEGKRMMESILNTARQFGYSEVIFLNIAENEWEGYNLLHPIPVPKGPNIIGQMDE